MPREYLTIKAGNFQVTVLDSCLKKKKIKPYLLDRSELFYSDLSECLRFTIPAADYILSSHLENFRFKLISPVHTWSSVLQTWDSGIVHELGRVICNPVTPLQGGKV